MLCYKLFLNIFYFRFGKVYFPYFVFSRRLNVARFSCNRWNASFPIRLTWVLASTWSVITCRRLVAFASLFLNKARAMDNRFHIPVISLYLYLYNHRRIPSGFLLFNGCSISDQSDAIAGGVDRRFTSLKITIQKEHHWTSLNIIKHHNIHVSNLTKQSHIIFLRNNIFSPMNGRGRLTELVECICHFLIQITGHKPSGDWFMTSICWIRST